MALAKSQVDARDGAGNTALHRAARQGIRHLVVLLLQSGANVETLTLSGGQNSLHLAAAAGHTELVPLLSTPSTLGQVDANNNTPLQLAARNHQWEAAAALVAAGASPSVPHFASSALAMALQQLQDPGAAHVASQLLRAMMRNPDSAEVLAYAVSGVNLQQQTVLHKAVHCAHRELVAALVEAGADRDAVDRQGVTPLMQAVVQGHVQLVPLLATPGNVNLLVDGGRSWPLYLAAFRGNDNMVAALLAAGAQPDMQLSDGHSALSVAAEYGYMRVLALLLPALLKQCEQPQRQAGVVALVAAATALLAERHGRDTDCARLLELVLDVLGPDVAQKVCRKVQQQLQQEWEQYPEPPYAPVVPGQASYLAEALLLGLVWEEERLHAARQPLVARLQCLVLSEATLAHQQRRQQHVQQRPADETPTWVLEDLVTNAELAAAAGQEQRAVQLLGRFTALHLRNQPCEAATRRALLSNGLVEAAHTRLGYTAISSPDYAMERQQAVSFRPPGVYTTFLAAWVGARRQLQQLPQEVAATVVAAVKAAQQQRQPLAPLQKHHKRRLPGGTQALLDHKAYQQQRRQQLKQQKARVAMSCSGTARACRLVLLVAASVLATAAAAPLVGWRLGFRGRKVRTTN